MYKTLRRITVIMQTSEHEINLWWQNFRDDFLLHFCWSFRTNGKVISFGIWARKTLCSLLIYNIIETEKLQNISYLKSNPNIFPFINYIHSRSVEVKKEKVACTIPLLNEHRSGSLITFSEKPHTHTLHLPQRGMHMQNLFG